MTDLPEKDEIVERVAEWLNAETTPLDTFPDRAWPTHENDDGYRGDGGYVHLVPPDVVVRCREDASRLLGALRIRDLLALLRERGCIVSHPAPVDDKWAVMVFTAEKPDAL